MTRPPENVLLTLAKGRLLAPAKRSALVTALLIQPEYDLFRVALRVVDSREVQVDFKLVLKLLRFYGNEGHCIATSAAVCRLPPRHFHPLFRRAWKRWANSTRQRIDLALTLGSFLRLNPGEGSRYRPLIRDLLFDPAHDVVLRGLSMSRFLAPMRKDELQRYIRCSRSTSWEKRVNVAHGVEWLLKSNTIPERTKRLSLQPPLLDALRRLTKDLNLDVRRAARIALRLAKALPPTPR